MSEIRPLVVVLVLYLLALSPRPLARDRSWVEITGSHFTVASDEQRVHVQSRRVIQQPAREERVTHLYSVKHVCFVEGMQVHLVVVGHELLLKKLPSLLVSVAQEVLVADEYFIRTTASKHYV